MSYVPSVSLAASVPDAMTDTITGAGSKTLSQADFLKLLVTQMTSQDPMNPQTDTQMAANMAQFTALQQASSMSTNIASLLAQQQILQANSMLGGTVTLHVDDKNTVSGVVQAVQMDDGVPRLIVNNKPYDLSQVLTIAPTPVAASSANPPTTFSPSTLPTPAIGGQFMP
jgi:flagellar basal-body rod modification protein FlgD